MSLTSSGAIYSECVPTNSHADVPHANVFLAPLSLSLSFPLVKEAPSAAAFIKVISFARPGRSNILKEFARLVRVT